MTSSNVMRLLTEMDFAGPAIASNSNFAFSSEHATGVSHLLDSRLSIASLNEILRSRFGIFACRKSDRRRCRISPGVVAGPRPCHPLGPDAFEDRGQTLPAPDAHCLQAVTRLTAPHFPEKGGQNPAAGGAEGMP
jgi:hypothetical protein